MGNRDIFEWQVECRVQVNSFEAGTAHSPVALVFVVAAVGGSMLGEEE